MDFRKLQIFTRVAELESFSQAALSLHMAQPAVSIAVRKLEESLGVTLFDRSGRKVSLTAEGHNLLGPTQAILQQVEDLQQASSDMEQLLQGELGIACPSMLATYFLPDLLSEFLTEHPGLRASVIQAGTARIEQMILNDEVEIGVTTTHESGVIDDLELVPLLKQSMLLCVTRDHPWAERRSIPITELQGSPMAVYESGYFIRSKLDQLCAEKNIQPDYRLQSNFLPLLLRMVRQGIGSTVGLPIMTDQESDLVGIPITPPAELSVGLAKRKGRTISRANQAFLDWVAFKL
jgi:DNA-binding transcriptional LysR family regulator